MVVAPVPMPLPGLAVPVGVVVPRGWPLLFLLFPITITITSSGARPPGRRRELPRGLGPEGEGRRREEPAATPPELLQQRGLLRLAVGGFCAGWVGGGRRRVGQAAAAVVCFCCVFVGRSGWQ